MGLFVCCAGVCLGSAKKSPKSTCPPTFLPSLGKHLSPLAYFASKRAIRGDKHSELSPISSQPGVNICHPGGHTDFSVWPDIVDFYPSLRQSRGRGSWNYDVILTSLWCTSTDVDVGINIRSGVPQGP